MLILYYKPTCPFSKKVLGAAMKLGLGLDLKNIKGNEVATKELIDLGGKKQTPFLVDTDKNIKMYESDEIIDYLAENYSQGLDKAKLSEVRVHNGQNGTCNTAD